MRKKILVISIFAAVLMILLPISAVVGTNIVKSNDEKRSIASPLFTKRVNSIMKKNTMRISTNYLGKGKFLNVFSTPKTSLHSWIDKALKLLDTNPELLNKVLNKLYEIPELVTLLKKHGVSKDYLNKEIALIKSDSSILQQKIDEAVQMYGEQHIKLPQIEPPKPLGFSGQIGCVLTFFLVVFPIIMMIGGFLSGILVVIIPGTFLIPGCLEWVFQKVFDSISEGFQGLTPP